MSKIIERRLAVAAIFLLGTAIVFAQSIPSEQPVPVQLDGRTVFYVRTTVKQFTPAARATGIAERMQRLASDHYFDPNTIAVIETDISSDIVAGDNIITLIFDADAQAENRGRQELAAERVGQIKAAINQYRLDHSTRNILQAAGFALLTTIVFLALLFLIQRVHRFSKGRLIQWIDKDSGALLTKYEMLHSRQIKAAMLSFLKLVKSGVMLVVLYFYVGIVFSFFPGTRNVAGQLMNYVTSPLSLMWQAVRLEVPKLFFILILIVVARYAIKLLHVLFRGIEAGTIEISGFYPDWAMPTYKLVKILVILFALTIAYPYIPGSGSEAFKGASLFLGLLVSLGSSSFVGNVIAGLMMTYMRAFKIGDRVKIDDFTGDVLETSLQVTHLKTPKNEIISVPNSKIINSHVINYSAIARDKGLILHTTVGIGYDTPWRQVRAMLLLAADETPGVLKQPAPFVFQKSLGDFCITYELNAYTDNAQQMPATYSDLHKHILDNFNEYQVQIMTPNYEGDRDAPALVPKDKWYAAPADQFADDGVAALEKTRIEASR